MCTFPNMKFEKFRIADLKIEMPNFVNFLKLDWKNEIMKKNKLINCFKTKELSGLVISKQESRSFQSSKSLNKLYFFSINLN